MSYNKNYLEWVNNPMSYWDRKSEDITWIKPYKKTLHKNADHYEWFHKGQLNTCFNCLDKHIENGRGDKIAIFYDSPIANIKKKNNL